MRFWSLLLLLTVAVHGADEPKAAPEFQHYIIGLSPYLDKSVKDETFRGLVRLLVDELPLNSSVSVFDAFNLRSITAVTLPNARAFGSPKTRANQFAPAIQNLRRFLATEPLRPTNSALNFNAAIRLPQFLEFLNETLPADEPRSSILLLGSPLYQDAKEPAFSMADGYYPSDAHLKAPIERSVYGLRGATKGPAHSFTVYWTYFGDPWLSDLHKQKITRFWTLYLEQRADHLVTFSGDLPTVLQNLVRTANSVEARNCPWTIDPEQTKIEMLRTGRDVQITDWIARDTLPEAAPPPPTALVGPMKIGIRWQNKIDLDLYATPRPGAETLFFEHARSPEGYYYHDHRSSPGREYEFIEFEKPVDARTVEAFVNFYKGSCAGGPHGEARIEFDGRIYTAAFIVRASEGNLGRAGRDQQTFWARIPVQEMLGILTEQKDSGARVTQPGGG